MPRKKREATLGLGDRARSKLNGRVGTIDAVEEAGGRPQRYGLHYDEEPQDRWIATPEHDGASLPPDLLERA
jgi:hypothetical protein